MGYEFTPIDKLMAADCLKDEIESEFNKAKADAEDYLAKRRDADGTTSLCSNFFGSEAGEYHYGKTRKKTVVEYNVCDAGDFSAWLDENPDAMKAYIRENAVAFGKYWFESTGEKVDGISRVEYVQPPMTTAPKIYKGNRAIVKQKLLESGNLLMGASQLLLGDGDA